jgi:hypothetical protein
MWMRARREEPGLKEEKRNGAVVMKGGVDPKKRNKKKTKRENETKKNLGAKNETRKNSVCVRTFFFCR